MAIDHTVISGLRSYTSGTTTISRHPRRVGGATGRPVPVTSASGWDGVPVNEKHARLLEVHAVTPEEALSRGIRSVETVEELPAVARTYWSHLVPGLLYPWRRNGRVDLQFATDNRDDHAKYLFLPGASGVIHEARIAADDAPVWILEGTKQTSAAASYASARIGLYGIVGCWGWSKADLSFANGRDVVVWFDGDLSANRDVFDAAERLADALVDIWAATSTRFVRLPASGKDGLDDVLGRVPHAERAGVLSRLAAKAGPLPKRPPRRKSGPKSENNDVTATSDIRLWIDVRSDRRRVRDLILSALRRQDGTEIFQFGGAFARLIDDQIEPLDRDLFGSTLQDAAVTYYTSRDEIVFALPESAVLGMAMKQARTFTPLDRVSRTPFVRADGTICQTGGYDAASRTLLLLDQSLGAINVPERPTEADVAAAVALLCDEWLADHFADMTDEASKANTLALALTPLIRGLVPIVPLAVLDGLQMGVGKNLLAKMISIVAMGHDEEPLPHTTDDEEQRKVITAAFRNGASIFCFDEAHVLTGGALSRALTSVTYRDRILGVSLIAEFPNAVTWMSLGNQVAVLGDMSRRVYRISLRPQVADPDMRPLSSFRHPQPDWTWAHRTEVLTALLTLVRAWFAGGQPWTPRPAGLGSFEPWERTVGGILQVAGVAGFLENTREWREEHDYDRRYWRDHLDWLRRVFGGEPFSCREVKQKLAADDSEPPPGLEDTQGRHYPRALGQAYARQQGRIHEGLRLEGASQPRKSRGRLWRVVGVDAARPTQSDDHTTDSETTRFDAGATGSPVGATDPATTPTSPMCGATAQPQHSYFSDPAHFQNTHESGKRGPSRCAVAPLRHLPIPPVPVTRLALDLETASVDQLWRGGPRFIRLAALSADDGPVQTTVDIDAVTQILQGAGRVVGHNLFGFDLLALARYHGLDIHALVQRGAVVDTLLLAFLDDPPPARINSGQAAKYYSLNSVGTRKFGEGKLGNLTVLAKKHGGYNQIPLDDPEYVAYIKRDVDLTRRLGGILPITDYARREHRVAAIAAQMTLNGFRVDEALLAKRLQAGRQRREELLRRLQDTYGVPITRKDGKPSKSPQNTQEGRVAIQAAFAQLGVSLPVTETGAPTTGKAAMESLIETHADNDPVCTLARTVKDINGVRTVYSTISDHLVDGRVHPDVNMRQASGRWSITNPGLTVMGKRDGRYAERDVFLPEPGHVVVSVDLAQIDARAIAALAQDPGYLALFASGRDVHAEVASQIWGDPRRREDAKAVSHGWNYGQGIAGIVGQTGVDWDVAEQFDTGMRERFPRLVEWRDGIRERAASGELLDNGFGRLMRPDVERAWTQGPALMGQGCARDLLMEGLLRLPPEVLPMLRAVVHDEVVLSVPTADADDIEKRVLHALSFSWAPPGALLSVEVVAGVGKRGASWGDCYRGGSK